MSARTPTSTRALDQRCFVFCLCILGLAVLYPTARLLFAAATHWRFDALLSGVGLAAIRNTFVISIATVLCAGLLGTVLAFALARYTFPGRDLLAALAYLPFALPPLVGVLSFYYLIGRDGLVPRFAERVLGLHHVQLDGPVAILLIHAYSFYVFFYAMISTAITSLDAAQIEAARTLGAGRLRIAARVVFPALRPAFVGAALLTFMSSVASFSAPYFFGHDFPMLSVRVFEERTQFHEAEALTLTLALAAMSLLGLVLFRSTPRSAASASKGVGVPIRGRVARVVAPLLLWASVLFLLTPHLCIAWMSLVDHRAWRTELIPTAFTLGNFTRLFQDPQTLGPIRNSLWMSAVAAFVTLAVAIPAGYLAGRKRRGGRLVYAVAMLPWALPGTVVAMNLIAAFNDPWLPIYNTVWLLPIAYVVRTVPMTARMAIAAIEPFDVSLIEAARTLGAPPAYCVRRVIAPLLLPAFAVAGALALVTCLGEFVTSILLYMPANVPIAVKINMEWRGSVGAAFAYSVLLMLIVSAVFAASRKLASPSV